MTAATGRHLPAQPLDVDQAVARQLLDPETLAQWCARPATVTPTTT